MRDESLREISDGRLSDTEREDDEMRIKEMKKNKQRRIILIRGVNKKLINF